MYSSLRTARMLGTLLLVSATALSAQAAGTLSFRSQTGDFIGKGQNVLIDSPPWTINATQVGTEPGRFVRFQMQGPGPIFAMLDFTARPGEILQPGAYEDAARASFAEASPGVDFSYDGAGCNQVTGRFTVLEASFGPGGAVNSFAANFEQHCEGAVPALFGEFRFNSSAPLSSASPPGDGTPDPFGLQAQSPVAPGALVTSNRITIYGINVAVPISITGAGEYSKNGGAFTTAAGTASNQDTIDVRLIASFTPGATTSTTFQAGGVSSTLAATTYQSGMSLSSLSYRSTTGDFIGQGRSRTYLTPTNFITASRGIDNSVQFALSGTGGSYFDLVLALPGNATPVAGTYENATRWPFQAVTAPGLDFSGEGRGCNTLAGRFVIREAVYNPDNSVQSFAADFEQRCEVTGPPLFGEIRFNSTVTPTNLLASPNACVTNADYRLDGDGDGIPDCYEAREGRSPVVKDNDVFSSPRLLVMQQYRDFFNREGDTAGIAHWTTQASGPISRQRLVEIFMRTPEFEGPISPLTRLYFAYFLRIPDYDGLNFWLGYLRAGNALDAISEYFATSGEFQATYGALDDAAFVDRIYLNVLGRAPDPGGAAFWNSKLQLREWTRGQVMTYFSQSVEFTSLTANEVLVNMAFFGMLRRAPAPAEFNAGTAALDAGGSLQQLIDSILNSAEYRNRFL